MSNFLQGTSVITDVPSYAQIVYRDVYPGIDAVFHASSSNDLEIDFTVAPGAVASAIGLAIDAPWTLTADGNVRICAGDAEFALRRPVAFQLQDGTRQPVEVAYALGPNQTVQFEIGAYDPKHPLVIDPVVSYATAIAKVRTINDIAVDKRENAYVVGSTVDSTFTTTSGAYDRTYNGNEDAVIIKYNKAGQRVFATFFGGIDVIDRAIGIAVDDEEQMYVTGWTSVGYDPQLGIVRFPVTPSAYQSYPYAMWTGGNGPTFDVFVTKFNSSGGGLLFSSLVAGSGEQEPVGIALGPPPEPRVYVAGYVTGPPNDPQYKQFPTTPGAYRNKFRGDATQAFNYDGFVFALSNDGSSLVASTLFGGLKRDRSNALAVDSHGDVWVAGHTFSFDFPKTANAYRPTFIGPKTSCGTGCADGFVVKFNAVMTQLLYGTFLPGSEPNNYDDPRDITTDSNDNVYVVGFTPSDDFPTTPGAYKTATHGGFLTKFNAAGQVQFSTVLGGATPSNSITSINAVRTSGDVVFVTGTTNATDFATKGPIQAQNGGGTDMFICALNGTGNLLEFSTYLGGTGGESVWKLDIDAASNLYMYGSSSSPNFPYSENAAEPAVSGSNTLYLKLSADRDGDGLLDWWELSGIDANGDGTIDLDLPALGADVDHKDLFVEIDYMIAAAHDHDPRTLPNGSAMATSAIAPVVAAFANAPVTNPDGVTGITLHALIDESIPEQPIITVEPLNSDFNRIKLGSPPSPCGTAHFGTVADRNHATNCANIIKAKRRVYRYALFAHTYAETIGSTGISEFSGNDLVVSLRTGEPIPDYEDFANAAATTYGTSLEHEWRDMVAGSFMHEFGHTLGLEHGGGFGVIDASSRGDNCKPNYISVMNYSRQTNMAGTAPGTTAPKIRTNRALDYSSSALSTLNESGLMEGNGVSGPGGMSILYGESTTGTPRVVAATDAIDWNGQNGIEATPVSADINHIRSILDCAFSSSAEFLQGHDDWGHLVYNFRLSAYYADGTSLPVLPELTDADVSAGVLGTEAPATAITAPGDGARFAAGATISLSATATDGDGSISAVYFVADDGLLATDMAAPYEHAWSGGATGTHIVRVAAEDDVGAVAVKQVTVHIGCTPAFTPTSASIVHDAGIGVFDMSLPSDCHWTATSDADWLTPTPVDGKGTATFTYLVADNLGSSSRTATISAAGQTFVVTQDAAPAFGPPTGVLATGTGVAPSISVTWHGTSGVEIYEVAFSSNGTSFTTAGSTQERFFDIASGLSANTAYLVKVRALNSSGTPSAYSSADLASTFVFTDDPLQSGVTNAKSVHWTELRTAVDAVRGVAGLSPATWTANVATGQAITRAAVEELRAALDGARSAIGLSAITYTDYPLPALAPIRAVHIAELRAGVE